MDIKLSKSYNYFANAINDKHVAVINKNNFLRYDLAEGLLYPRNRGKYAHLPDASSSLLRAKLAVFLNIKPELISIFAGADEVIEIIPRVLLNEDNKALVVVPTFDRLIYTNLKVGGKVVLHRLGDDKNFVFNIKEAEKITDLAKSLSVKIIWLCSPNNPTGLVIKREYIKKIAQDNPHTLVAVDECYQEYQSLDSQDSAVSLIKDCDNLLVIRSFSKAFSIAGARMGYAVATEEIIRLMDKYKTKFNVSVLAQSLAIQLLEKEELAKMKDYLILIRSLRKNFENKLETIPSIKYIHGSVTNFVFMKHMQKNLFKELIQRGILVKDWNDGIGIEGKGYSRVSFSNESDNTRLLEVLKNIN